ncbi:MAG: type II toxin-antitoxin system death-on-curing family toxin [Xanthomonadales bacterium]|nr:type II toxin-antitoxin system death-on-curing family toxin [Xanthomonadales bacterium]
MSEPVWLLESVVLIAHEISLSEHGGGSGIRDHGLLESALARPRNLFEYGEPGIPELAAAYMAGIVRNHPFVDGNKRAGFLAGAAFLELNGYRLVASEPDATQAVMALAAGQLMDEDLAEWLTENSEIARENG